MLISTKGRYALRVMLELAKSEEAEYLPLSAISSSQEISVKYMENIVSVLAKAGLVDGARGKNGGYRLNRAPEEYTLGEILRTAEGSLAPVACLALNDENAACSRSDKCEALPVWKNLEKLICDYLDSVTLADLLK